MRRLAAVLLVVAAASLNAQSFPDPDFERVLVPVFFAGPGAHGSNWTTEVSMLSSGGDVDLGTPVVEVGECPTLCPLFSLLPAWSPQRVAGAYDPAGILLWVPRTADRDTIHIEARVRDLSRQSESAGTEVPVVWERDLPGNRMMLINVPIDARFRTSLRLFDAYLWPTTYLVRIFDMATLDDPADAPLVETSIDVVNPVVNVLPERFAWRPAYAVVGDLVAAYPQLAGVHSVAIEIIGTDLLTSPPAPDHRFYAMASVTNNETQEVTIIRPRCCVAARLDTSTAEQLNS